MRLQATQCRDAVSVLISSSMQRGIGPPEPNVSAPRKARRIWSGESPGMVRANHPPLPSVAPLAERCFGKETGAYVNKRGEAYTGYVVDRSGTQTPRAGIASKRLFRSASVVTCVKPTRSRRYGEPEEGRRSSQAAVCNNRCVVNAGDPCGSCIGTDQADMAYGY